MKILFLGLGIFCLAFVLHLIVWKMRLPKRHIKAMIVLFLSILFVSLGFIPYLSLQIYEYFHITFLFICLTLFYVANYSAIEADSPSLLMLLEIFKARNRGVKKEDFFNRLPDSLLVLPRINDLILAKMAYIDRDKYHISKKGRIFVRIFILYRKFLGLPEGG